MTINTLEHTKPYENVLPVPYSSLYLLAEISIGVLQVVTGVPAVVHQRQVTVIGDVKKLKQVMDV